MNLNLIKILRFQKFLILKTKISKIGNSIGVKIDMGNANLLLIKADKDEKVDFLNFIRENKGYELRWEFETIKKSVKGLKFEEEILNLIAEIEKYGVRK